MSKIDGKACPVCSRRIRTGPALAGCRWRFWAGQGWRAGCTTQVFRRMT